MKKIELLKEYYKIINTHLKDSKLSQVSVILLTVLSTLCVIIYNWTFKYILDDGLLENNIQVLVFTAIIFVILFLASQLFNVLKNYMLVRINQKALIKIKMSLYEHIMRQNYEFFIKNSSGNILYRIMNDVDRTQSLVFETIVDLSTNVLTILLTSTWMFIINWKFTLVLMLIIPLFILVIKHLGNKLYLLSKYINKIHSDIMSAINETISGVYFIKTHVAYNVFLNRLGKLFSSFAHKSLKYTLTSSLSSSLIYSLINPLMAIYVLIYGISFIKTGTPSIGAIFAYTNYFGIVFPAVVSVYNLYFKAASITVNVERVLEYLHSKPEQSGRIEEFDNYNIYINNLTFSYNTNQILLRDISLEIPEGSSVAIVGETGSGKSTLVNLLLRIFDVTDGSIRYGSYDIKEYNTDFLRKNIAIVSQEPFLFNTSIKENLMFANPSSTMEEIINAAKLAQIHDRILQSPDGYDSIIGENGIKLSGGEKQRLSISRVILRNPKIVIMDEPTSSLDIITERKLMSGILNLLENKTVILITHKLFMLEQFDKIIVLNKGKASQYNSYHELISKQRSLKE